jgi:hypothetical protein
MTFQTSTQNPLQNTVRKECLDLIEALQPGETKRYICTGLSPQEDAWLPQLVNQLQRRPDIEATLKHEGDDILSAIVLAFDGTAPEYYIEIAKRAA